MQPGYEHVRLVPLTTMILVVLSKNTVFANKSHCDFESTAGF